MNTEEKARRYDEALNWMREIYPGLHGATKEDAEHFFPELTESEDDRIRKSIIHILQVGGYMSPEEKDKAFAYLEKQKEQKPLTTEETELNSIAFLEQMGYTCIPPGKEQKPAQTAEEKEYVRTLKGLISDFIRDCGGCTIDTEYYQKICNWLDGRHIEQKPAEKQDYSGLNDFERAIHRGFLSAGVENVPVTIIKETAKECLAQIKTAEWDEEDREIAQTIMVFLKEPTTAELCPQLRKECQDWLKSLLLQGSKDSLQTHWKPSEDDKQYFDNLVVMFEKSLRINRCYFTSYDVDWLKSKLNGNSGK